MADERQLPFKCPNPKCGRVFTQPLSWFKDNKSFTCPFCNAEIAIDFEKLSTVKATLKKLRKP